ncbi:MAG: LTA synthase family protein [Atopobiaceae bacterium]|nr:LTA synthase family protein [Atopobiaceae bacterium]
MDDARFEQASYGARWWAIVALVCLAALMVVGVRRIASQRRCKAMSAARIGWFVPFPVLLAGIFLWYACGAGAQSAFDLVLCCALIAACGIASLCPRELVAAMSGRRTLRMGTGVAVMGTLALEFMWNDKVSSVGPQFALIELALVGGLLAVLWLACGRRGIGPALGLGSLAVLGAIQHYVLEFRGTSILPSDLFAAGTAMSVSGGYTYGLSDGMLGGLAALSAGLLMASLMYPARQLDLADGKGHAVLALRPLASIGLLAATVAAMAALVCVPDYGTTFGADLDYWWSKDWYERQGFIPSFVYAWQDMAIRAPNGYTDELAQAAEDALSARYESDADVQTRRAASTEQFVGRCPNIIAIQNETFCDLSNFDGLRNGYAGPAFWNEGMTDALMRGSFAVSVFGGGTCNTEFEFLTGNALAFVGTAKYPFTMYDLGTTDSLPRQLSACGYHTLGMHPNLASNWNRDRAYEQLGFDEFLSEDDFAGAEEFHTHVSDWATYERTLDLLRATDKPLFVFDVTMQNHSGYDTGSIPQDMLRNYAIDGLSADDTFQLNEFLACIDESDRALQRLVAELRQLDEPTVVIMYGDHHPWFSAALNDVLFAGEDDLTHAERIHQTSYVVWANYDVAGWSRTSDTDDTSADLLAAMTLDAIGAPLSPFQTAQLGARQQIRSLNANGLLGSDGAWHALDDPGEYAQTLEELALVAHRNFGASL